MARNGARPALEEAEGDLADDEDEGHEDGGQVAVVDAESPRRCRQSAAVAGRERLGRHAGSLSACTRFVSGRANSSILPEGQRTTTFSTAAAGAQAEVQPPLVLGAEARAARDLLHLLLAVPVHRDLRADGAAVACSRPGPRRPGSRPRGRRRSSRGPGRPRCGRAAAVPSGWPPPRRARRGSRGRPGPPTGRRSGR